MTVFCYILTALKHSAHVLSLSMLLLYPGIRQRHTSAGNTSDNSRGISSSGGSEASSSSGDGSSSSSSGTDSDTSTDSRKPGRRRRSSAINRRTSAASDQRRHRQRPSNSDAKRRRLMTRSTAVQASLGPPPPAAAAATAINIRSLVMSHQPLLPPAATKHQQQQLMKDLMGRLHKEDAPLFAAALASFLAEAGATFLPVSAGTGALAAPAAAGAAARSSIPGPILSAPSAAYAALPPKQEQQQQQRQNKGQQRQRQRKKSASAGASAAAAGGGGSSSAAQEPVTSLISIPLTAPFQQQQGQQATAGDVRYHMAPPLPPSGTGKPGCNAANQLAGATGQPTGAPGAAAAAVVPQPPRASGAKRASPLRPQTKYLLLPKSQGSLVPRPEPQQKQPQQQVTQQQEQPQGLGSLLGLQLQQLLQGNSAAAAVAPASSGAIGSTAPAVMLVPSSGSLAPTAAGAAPATQQASSSIVSDWLRSQAAQHMSMVAPAPAAAARNPLPMLRPLPVTAIEVARGAGGLNSTAAAAAAVGGGSSTSREAVGDRPPPPPSIDEWMKATAQKQQQDYRQRHQAGTQLPAAAAAGGGRGRQLAHRQLAGESRHRSPLARLQAEAAAASERGFSSSGGGGIAEAGAAQGWVQAPSAAAAAGSHTSASAPMDAPVAAAAALWSQAGASALHAIATTLSSSPSRNEAKVAGRYQHQAPAATAAGGGSSRQGGGHKRPLADASSADQTRSRKPKKPRQLPSPVAAVLPPASASAAGLPSPLLGGTAAGFLCRSQPPTSTAAQASVCGDDLARTSHAYQYAAAASEALPSFYLSAPMQMVGPAALSYVQRPSPATAPESVAAAGSVMPPPRLDVRSEPGVGAAAAVAGGQAAGMGVPGVQGGTAATATTPTRAALFPVAVIGDINGGV